LLAELQHLDEEQEQGKSPDLPKVGADLAHVVQVLLKTNDSDDREALSNFVHQAHVRRHVVVQTILNAKARGRRAYVRVDEQKMKEKAESLPVNGIPMELTHLLPNDESISKLHIQKAATPVEGLRADVAGAARAIAIQRPNAVVLEKSCNDEADINERGAYVFGHLVKQMRSGNLPHQRKAYSGASSSAATGKHTGQASETPSVASTNVRTAFVSAFPTVYACTVVTLLLASFFLSSSEQKPLSWSCVQAARSLHANPDERSKDSWRHKLRSLSASSQVRNHKFFVGTGSSMMNQ
jgi:hypothetical protein